MKVQIITSRLPPHNYTHKYLRDGKYYDILGQIILQKGYDIADQTRTPEDMLTLIPGITFQFRGKIRNTPTTMSILLLDHHDRDTLPQKMGPLAQKLGLELEWVNTGVLYERNTPYEMRDQDIYTK